MKVFLLAPTLFVRYRVKIEGKENIPKNLPVILVCKHASFIDLFVLPFVTPRCMYYMAKSELFDNLFGDYKGTLLEKVGRLIAPFTGNALKVLGAIPLNRENPAKTLSAFKVMERILKQNNILVFFPEGKVVPKGLGDFKKGLFKIALRIQRRIKKKILFIPVGISYGTGGFKKEVLVNIGKGIFFNEFKPSVVEKVRGEILNLIDSHEKHSGVSKI